MNTSIKRLVAAAFTLCGITSAFPAADVASSTWLGDDGYWDDPTRWSSGWVPAEDEIVGATNYYKHAEGPYTITITNGVTACCQALRFDSKANDNDWTAAPTLDVLPGGSLACSSYLYMNYKSRVKVWPGAMLCVTNLYVGQANGFTTYGARSSGCFVNEGTTVVKELNMRREGIVTNAGDFVVANMALGGDSGGATFVMTGGTLMSGGCSFANGGSDSYKVQVEILGGCVTNTGSFRVSYAVRDHSGTRFVVSGPETRWINTNTGSGSENGNIFGKYNANAQYSTNCWMVVANGARFEHAYQMCFGLFNSENVTGQRIESILAVTNKAELVCRNNMQLTKVGKASTDCSVEATMLVDDANVVVTNAGHTAKLVVGSPAVGAGTTTGTGVVTVRNGGLLSVDSLEAVQGADSSLALPSGVLRARAAVVDGDGAQVVGSADAIDGEWRLGAGGVNEFRKGLNVLAGSSLGVEIDADGTCGFANASGQSLVFASGSRLNVAALEGFTPTRHQTFDVAVAETIVGLPKPPRDWQVAVVQGEDGQHLSLTYNPVRGMMLIVR